MPLAAKGEFALVTENIKTALSKPGQPVKRGTMAHDHHMLMLLTESAVQRRDAAAIREHAGPLQELAERDGHRLYQGIAHRAWGVAHRLAGDQAEAETRLNQAMELFRSLDANWQVGRTLFELADLALARGDAPGARHSFLRALRLFETLNAAPDAARTQAALAAAS